MRLGERGSVTIWGIGMVLVIFGMAGLVVDTWRVFSERQDLAGMADSAAVAGATAVDVVHFRNTGDVILEPGLAQGRAIDYLMRQDGWDSTEIDFSVDPTFTGITVTLERDVDFTILGAFIDGPPLHITIDAFAQPGEAIP